MEASMNWFTRRFRSGGMRVTRRTHRHIRAGDAARDALDWTQAATHYGKVVLLEPRLAHIQVQLGHALKEGGRLVPAREAYRAASVLVPGDREPWLYLGEVSARLGHHEQAVEHYCRMLAIDATDGEAAAGLAAALRHIETSRRMAVVDWIRPILADALDLDQPTVTDGATTVVAFDISDLVPFLRHGKRPTGIQRVQLETVAAALSGCVADVGIALCCMDEASDRWRGVAPVVFRRLVAALTQDFDASRCDRLFAQIQLALLIAPDFDFADNSVLVNLGASWWLGNYFLALRSVQANKRVAYLPFVHDLIPIVHPEWHVASLVGEFTNWFSGAVAHADAFITNSDATRRDLIRAAALAKTMVDPTDVAVVRLDAGTKVEAHSPARAVAPDPRLPATPFVLMIGTVEPRKGHDTALAAWRHLLAQGTAPRLVCVGGRGWLSDNVFGVLADDPDLAAHVELLSGVDDDTLARLYDQALFTIYPSRYEGWGLPVTEALCRGKVVVTTSTSSLPEAGGEFALYVPPGDPVALAAMVSTLLDSPDWRAALEMRIEKEFRPRSWRQIAEQIVTQATRVAVLGPHIPRSSVRPALLECFYSLRRTTHQPLPAGTAAGEAFRMGAGWHWPDNKGSGVSGAEGGRLTFAPLSGDQPITSVDVKLLLSGMEHRSCHWRLVSSSGAISEGVLAPSDRRWVSVGASASSQGSVTVTISSPARSMTGNTTLSTMVESKDGIEYLRVEGFVLALTNANNSVILE
jgi:glycosyltransferase involved in cell wall biosynthesis